MNTPRLSLISVALAAALAACAGGGEPSTTSRPAVDTSSAPTTIPAPTSTSMGGATTSSASSPTSTTSSSTTASTTSSTTTGGETGGQAIEEFRSPTGNIHCGLSADGARCSHHADTPWKAGGALPHWAEGVSFGFTEIGCVDGGFVGFEVAATGRPRATCGDGLFTAPAVTLDYGERRTLGDVSCLSQRFGMTCLNADGNGFRMATNEIAMLYDRPAGWSAASSSTADEHLVPTRTSALDGAMKVSNESDSVFCYLASQTLDSGDVAIVECRSTSDRDGVEWSPDGRSCAGADFLGYYLDDDVRASGRRVATFGCTTDVSPLIDPTVTAKRIAAGEAVTLGGITCLSTGPAIACHNLDGNGMLTAVDEVSFFYGRQVPRG